MRIAIGTDHRGFLLKNELITYHTVGSHTLEWLDVGTYSSERTDYPLYARKVVKLILSNEASLGILLCGSGIGVTIAANRFKGIYAGLVWNPQIARLAKEDDNCNIIALPADYLNVKESIAIIDSWLSSTFKSGRYQERLKLIDNYDE